MSFIEQETLTLLVSRIFDIQDVTAAPEHSPYLYRYRGQLTQDSLLAYDALAESLRPYSLQPLFRQEEDRQVIYIAKSAPLAAPSNRWLNLLLYILTIFSVIISGVQIPQEMPADLGGQLLLIWQNLPSGIPFALSLLSILTAHELGHYFMARRHHTSATLPYFLPMPFSLFGTLGAVILWKELPKNKRVLFDVGVAGPLAGFVVALPLLFYGLSISTLNTIQPSPNSFLEGNSLLYLLAKFIVFGRLLPEPATYSAMPLLHWLGFFFSGYPVPFGGADVFISPVAFAAWAGLFVTALNLLPAGQLDGGHILYVLFGKRLQKAFPFLVGILVLLGFAWSGWWLWAVMLFFFGRQSAEPLDQITPLNPARRALAWGMILLFLLVFTPVPLIPLG